MTVLLGADMCALQHSFISHFFAYLTEKLVPDSLTCLLYAV